MSLGVPELLIIFAIVIVLFGATRIADLGGAMGKGISEFRRGLRDDENKSNDKPVDPK